ncbi:MAG: hypothetical protein ABI317_16470 [Gaiellales bacterium]
MAESRVLAGAVRRFALLVLSAAGVAGVVSLLIGLAAGSPVLRSLSVGFYACGALAVVLGVALGVRGPGRTHGEAISDSALFVVLGLVLLVLGVLSDPRYPIL